MSQSYDSIAINNDRSENYLVKCGDDKMFFSFSNYKTNKKYGEFIAKVEGHLREVVQEWLDIWRPNVQHNYFVMNQRTGKWTNNGLGKAIPRVFQKTGKKITLNLLRKMCVTEKFGGQDKERQDAAKAMGHTVRTQQSVYLKDEPSSPSSPQ